jgi:hypothetical protein
MRIIICLISFAGIWSNSVFGQIPLWSLRHAPHSFPGRVTINCSGAVIASSSIDGSVQLYSTSETLSFKEPYLRLNGTATAMKFRGNGSLLCGTEQGQVLNVSLDQSRRSEINLSDNIDDFGENSNNVALITSSGFTAVLDSNFAIVDSFRALSGKHHIAIGKSYQAVAFSSDAKLYFRQVVNEVLDSITMPNRILGLALTSDDQSIFVACQGGFYSVSRSTKQVDLITETETSSFEAKFSRSLQKVAYLYQDKVVTYSTDNAQKKIFQARFVQQADLSYSGDTVLILGIRTLDLRTSTSATSLWGLHGSISGTSVWGEKQLYAVSGQTGILGSFDLSSRNLTWLREDHSIDTHSSLSANDSLIFINTWNGGLTCFHSLTGDSLFVLPPLASLKSGFHVLKDSTLYVSYSDSVIRVWNTVRHAFIDSFRVPTVPRNDLMAVSSDQKFIAGGDETQYFVYSIEEHRVILSKFHFVTPILSLDFGSSDSTLLVGAQQTVTSVDTRSGFGDYYHYSGVAYYSPDNMRVVTVGIDSTLEQGPLTDPMPAHRASLFGYPVSSSLNRARSILVVGSDGGDIQAFSVFDPVSEVSNVTLSGDCIISQDHKITIRNSGVDHKSLIRLYSINGQVLQNSECNSEFWISNHLINGIYFLRLDARDNSKIFKVIVNQ